MSDEDNGEVAAADESALSAQVTEDQGGETAAGTDNGEQGGAEPSAAETEARKMGWVPETEWKGDKKPAKFFSAEEFVERGETILPIVRSQLEKERAERAKEKKEFEDRVSRMEKMGEKRLEQQRKNLIAEYDAKEREAVKLGDEEGYDAAKKAREKALKDLDGEAEAEVEKAKDGALSPAELSAFTEWKSENAWFQKDKKLTILMDAEFADLNDEMPGATFAVRLAEARKRVAAIYPEKFGETTTRRAPAVEGGARVPGGGQAGKLFDKLPAEAKAQAKKDVENKLYPSLEDWAKVYVENE